MDPDKVHFADSSEIMKRKAAFDRFVDKLFEPELRPWFVSDEATIFEISGDTVEEIISKIKSTYGIELTHEQLRTPLWRLLDLLESDSPGKAK